MLNALPVSWNASIFDGGTKGNFHELRNEGNIFCSKIDSTGTILTDIYIINFKPIDGSCTIYAVYLAELWSLDDFLSYLCSFFFFRYLLWETKGDKPTDFHTVTELGMRYYFQIIKEGFPRFFWASLSDLQLEGRL